MLIKRSKIKECCNTCKTLMIITCVTILFLFHNNHNNQRVEIMTSTNRVVLKVDFPGTPTKSNLYYACFCYFDSSVDKFLCFVKSPSISKHKIEGDAPY